MKLLLLPTQSTNAKPVSYVFGWTTRNYTLFCKIHINGFIFSTDICAVRLDFETFVTLGPLSNQEGGTPSTAAGHTTHECADKLTASVVL